jgi:hypothetical protein
MTFLRRLWDGYWSNRTAVRATGVGMLAVVGLGFGVAWGSWTLVASRVLSKRGSDARVYIEVSALQGLARLWMEMQIGMASRSETQVISARMLRGNIKGFEAEWQVTPVDAKTTLVAFEMCADPDFAIPFADGLVSDYNEKEARKSLLALRDYVGRAQRK